ncbi:MAG TPA: copper chaperone PCu(A)C [Micropepsaceae bacterium]|nr:copper chaperone PCu(A)C [Micropepsaceae bacterium]
MRFGGFGKTNLTLSGTVAASLMCGSLAIAQPTLPLPAPGTSPVPAVTPDAAAAKARAAALAAKANIDVAEAWTRATSGANAPVYLHIVSAKDPDRLLGIDSAIAKSVELREDKPQSQGLFATVMDIPAGGTVNLGPGGRYLMLTGLKAPLKEGDSFLITLHFDKAGNESAAVKVLASGANGYPPAAGRRGDTTASVSQH